VQLALPHLLREGARVREEIRQRAAGNSEQLASILDATPALALIPPEGGWSAVLRFPRVVDEETLALDLLASHGVAVQPGYFFDFPEEGYVAMSLLPEPEIFREGVRRLVECITSRLTP
jgi:aspartate/methionine/tyrosine aminotransferase